MQCTKEALYDAAMNLVHIKTPCVGICSTGIGDDVCRGCKRYAHEVIDWNGYTYSQKAHIEVRLVTLLTQIIQNKFIITDEERLKWQIQNQPVTVSKHRNLYCQAYELLKAGASQIKNLDNFGLQLMPEFENFSIKMICDDVDHEFYTLSVAHYQRYFHNFA